MPLHTRHRILVIDSDQAYLNRICLELRKHFEVFCLNKAEDALEKIDLCVPDLVILESDLPGMDGVRFAHLMHHNASYRNVPFIFLSWHDSEADIRLGYMVHAAMYLSKHTPLHKIVERIQHYIEQRHLPIRPKPPKSVCEHHEEEVIAATEEIEQEKAEDVEEKEPIAPKQADRPRVLVACPEYAMIFSFQSLLQDSLDCISASDGLEAVEKARRYLPDIIIISMNMPQMPGFEVSQILRESPSFRYNPIFGLLCRGEVANMEFKTKHGFTEVYRYPSETNQLVARIRRVLRDPSFVCHVYPQPFNQVWIDEEKKRSHPERIGSRTKKLLHDERYRERFTPMAKPDL